MPNIYESLTDDEIRQELVKRGLNAGPITPSTRKMYLKKLQQQSLNEVAHEQAEVLNFDDDEESDSEQNDHSNRSNCAHIDASGDHASPDLTYEDSSVNYPKLTANDSVDLKLTRRSLQQQPRNEENDDDDHIESSRVLIPEVRRRRQYVPLMTDCRTANKKKQTFMSNVPQPSSEGSSMKKVNEVFATASLMFGKLAELVSQIPDGPVNLDAQKWSPLDAEYLENSLKRFSDDCEALSKRKRATTREVQSSTTHGAIGGTSTSVVQSTSGAAFYDKLICAKTTSVSRRFFESTGGIVHLPRVLAPPPNPLPSKTTEMPKNKCKKCGQSSWTKECHTCQK